MREQEMTKVEFLLMCNDNIVVQRFFNVKDLTKTHTNQKNFMTTLNRSVMNFNTI